MEHPNAWVNFVEGWCALLCHFLQCFQDEILIHLQPEELLTLNFLPVVPKNILFPSEVLGEIRRLDFDFKTQQEVVCDSLSFQQEKALNPRDGFWIHTSKDGFK